MTPEKIIATAIAELRVSYVNAPEAHEAMMRKGLVKYQERAAPWRTIRIPADPTPLESAITLPFPSGCRRFYAATDSAGAYIDAFEDLATQSVVIERGESPVFPLCCIFYLDLENLALADELPPEVSAGVLFDWMVASLEIPNEGRVGDLGKALGVDFSVEDHAVVIDRRKEIEATMGDLATLPMLTVST